jgi:NAD(P) transhydrogenase subunit alpha
MKRRAYCIAPERRLAFSKRFPSFLSAPGIVALPAMDNTPFLEMYVFLLAGFLGYQVITRVPALLHTPLMSATNAISGISLVGSLVAAGADRGALSTTLGVVAVTAATINVVGGFMITDRMLKMFKRQEKK